MGVVLEQGQQLYTTYNTRYGTVDRSALYLHALVVGVCVRTDGRTWDMVCWGPPHGHNSCAVFKAFSLKMVQQEELSPGDEVVFSLSHVSSVGKWV